MTNDYGNLELHKVLLSAMKDIDKICNENDLKYYIYAGTLLGAVNFKGFIPWDDDVDIVMFPSDFAKFQNVTEQEYQNRYELKTFNNNADWYSKMNKLLINVTMFITSDGKESNIFIDICVLHSIPDSRFLRFLQRKKIEITNLALAVKSGQIIPTSLLSKLTIGTLGKLDKVFLGNFLDKVMNKYDGKNTEYVGIMCNTISKNPYTGRTGYDTDLTKREWHGNYKYVDFEDTRFMTFGNVEEYLDYQFSPKWREPYPEEKRITKHDVKTYTISDEVRQRVGI